MSVPTHTATVTLSDTHAHTLVLQKVPLQGGNIMAGKLMAAIEALDGLVGNAAISLASFTAADTLTITVTQP